MPYRMQWVPASKDESLIVHDKKPDGPCYECHYCGGWIEGRENRYRVNTLAPLAGRRGTVMHCRRCGNEIDFFGVVS